MALTCWTVAELLSFGSAGKHQRSLLCVGRGALWYLHCTLHLPCAPQYPAMQSEVGGTCLAEAFDHCVLLRDGEVLGLEGWPACCLHACTPARRVLLAWCLVLGAWPAGCCHCLLPRVLPTRLWTTSLLHTGFCTRMLTVPAGTLINREEQLSFFGHVTPMIWMCMLKLPMMVDWEQPPSTTAGLHASSSWPMPNPGQCQILCC